MQVLELRYLKLLKGEINNESFKHITKKLIEIYEENYENSYLHERFGLWYWNSYKALLKKLDKVEDLEKILVIGPYRLDSFSNKIEVTFYY